MSARISLDNRLVLEFLHGLRGKVDDMTSVMDKIGAKMGTRVLNRFETRTNPMGVPWSPRTESADMSRVHLAGRLLNSSVVLTFSVVPPPAGIDKTPKEHVGISRLLVPFIPRKPRTTVFPHNLNPTQEPHHVSKPRLPRSHR